MTTINIETRDGCVLVKGQLTINAMNGVTAMAPKGAVIDTDLARMAGVGLAAGLPADVAALKAKLKAKIEQSLEGSTEGGRDPALERWLALGERGSSSNAMVAFLANDPRAADAFDRKAHPHDPSDLKRCRLLLEQVPSLEAPFRVRMGELSPVRRRLVDAWDELCATMDAEMPAWREDQGSARKTYDRMRELIDGGV
jgi:hypothetical protein